jgi:uncharacterized membrane protein
LHEKNKGEEAFEQEGTNWIYYTNHNEESWPKLPSKRRYQNWCFYCHYSISSLWCISHGKTPSHPFMQTNLRIAP